MAVLSKFEITYKNSKSEDVSFLFQYNPTSLAINKTVSWEGYPVSGEDLQKKQFSSGSAKKLSVKEILFDTSLMGGSDVYNDFILGLEKMLLVDEFEDANRPPILELTWGNGNYFFDCVLTSLDYNFTMFNRDGNPIRAMVNLDFEEIVVDTTSDGKKPTSTTVSKYKVRTGDTLQSIAKSELGSENKWKSIAIDNGIDNPLELEDGTDLTIRK